MGTPQSLDDFELPITPIAGIDFPPLLTWKVEGTAEQLPKRIAQFLRLYGFQVTLIERPVDPPIRIENKE